VMVDLPMQEYVGHYNNVDVTLITNGEDPVHHVQNVGTQAATLSTYLGIENSHPDFIISIGAAGGLEQNGAKEKEIYVSQKIYFYDRRIAAKDYHEYALGAYSSADISSIDKKIGLKQGIICSGDSFDNNQMDYHMFIQQRCVAIDMEAAGVAWIAMLTKTPMVAIKGITNFVKGKNIHSQYQKNLPVVTVALSQKLKELLGYLSQS
jgi:5'-methylthioadenosine nucleosidase